MSGREEPAAECLVSCSQDSSTFTVSHDQQKLRQGRQKDGWSPLLEESTQETLEKATVKLMKIMRILFVF